MKIIGSGVDIVENSRIKKSIVNNIFLKRVFTKEEILILKKLKIKSLILPKNLPQKKHL